jgi:outer membrane protein TolC
MLTVTLNRQTQGKPHQDPPAGRACGLAAVCSVLAACATYSPLPLAKAPTLAAAATALSNPPSSPAAPFTVARVGELAIENDPDLRAARTQHGEAQAQLVQAGVLPNPQLAGSALPLTAGPGTTTLWTASLAYDVKSLITYRARRDAARATVGQVDAQILWQEWQVASQARLLAVDLIEGQHSLELLREARDLFAARAERLQAAVAAGNLTLADAAPYVGALQTAAVNLDAQDRRMLWQRHQLNALLGLAPDAVLPLAQSVDVPLLDTGDVQGQLASLAQRRPDLVALQLGYAAQDAKLRAAILGQFPNLILGAAGGSDNANVRNAGPTISMSLPIFDRNQGGVAIETATRRRLQEEYSARLTAAHGQVLAILTERAQVQAQLARLRSEMPGAEAAARKALAAAATRNLDERALVDLLATRAAKAQQVVTLEQTLAEQQVALATLVGAGLPAVEPLLPREASR